MVRFRVFCSVGRKRVVVGTKLSVQGDFFRVWITRIYVTLQRRVLKIEKEAAVRKTDTCNLVLVFKTRTWSRRFRTNVLSPHFPAPLIYVSQRGNPSSWTAGYDNVWRLIQPSIAGQKVVLQSETDLFAAEVERLTLRFWFIRFMIRVVYSLVITHKARSVAIP